jgi:hypothetical protein
MPQRKDPEIPVRVGVAACPWPGATAQQVEQFITRKIEDVAAENKTIHPGTDADYGIKSISLPGYSFVHIQLDEGITDTKRQFRDINLKLNALNSQPPQRRRPRSLSKADFGDTAALMLTVASPKVDAIEIAARSIPSKPLFARLGNPIPGIEKGSPSLWWSHSLSPFPPGRFLTPVTSFKTRLRAPESFKTPKLSKATDSSLLTVFPTKTTARFGRSSNGLSRNG